MTWLVICVIHSRAADCISSYGRCACGLRVFARSGFPVNGLGQYAHYLLLTALLFVSIIFIFFEMRSLILYSHFGILDTIMAPTSKLARSL